MNKYQRAKSKRRKRLIKLGIRYSTQQYLFRHYPLEELDIVIKHIAKVRSYQPLPIVEKMKQYFKNSQINQ